VLQSLTTVSHGAAITNTAFANSSVQLGRTNTTLWKAGRVAEFALWPGVTITAAEAKSLASGASPLNVHPDGLGLYLPLLGDSPEPDYSGGRHSATLTGTSIANHPGVVPPVLRPRPVLVSPTS